MPSKRRLNSTWFFRITDANLNRSREGLRVCEDISRFILEDKYLSREFRTLRHRLTKITNLFGFPRLLKNRNVMNDIGRIFPLERYKRDLEDIFFANIQRIKESVRVLEELSRISDVSLSGKIRYIRFRVYYLERLAYERIQSVCHHR
ncbi:MAG: thiamine-phosphate pyrophosphorylase [Candidatus Omnitrophica bacterium]|nr:thiamine-phosphate pyrophosphorylase [Candidatus Omnitrophota bacterium]